MSIPSLNNKAKYNAYSVGSTVVVDGFKFERSKNGLWKLIANKKLRDYLTNHYVKREMTLRKLSEFSGHPMATLQNLLNDFGLMRKKKPNSNEEVFKFCSKNKDKLLSMYHDDGRNVEYILDKINSNGKIHVTRRQLSSYFNSIELERRSHAEAIRTYRKLGRGYSNARGSSLFSDPAVRSWDYHLDMDLSRLTYNQYKRVVYRFTYMAISRLPNVFPDLAHKKDRKALGISGVDLDHQFSVSSGYYELIEGQYVKRDQVVPLEVMCHPCNLKLIPEKINCIKGARNHKSLKQLIDEIEKFKKKHGDIFDDYYGTYSKDEVVALYKTKSSSDKDALCLSKRKIK